MNLYTTYKLKPTREHHGQPEKETAEEDRQTQAEEAAQIAAAQEEVILLKFRRARLRLLSFCDLLDSGVCFFRNLLFHLPARGFNYERADAS